MNKRRFVKFFSLCMLLLSLPTAAFSEGVDQDGNWWRAVPEDAKAYIVVGMVSAFQAGHFAGQMYGYALSSKGLATVAPSLNILYSTTMRLAHAIDDANKKDLSPAEQSFGKTIGTYIHGVDDFYANYPQSMNTPVGYVIGCLADEPVQDCSSLAKSWQK